MSDGEWQHFQRASTPVHPASPQCQSDRVFNTLARKQPLLSTLYVHHRCYSDSIGQMMSLPYYASPEWSNGGHQHLIISQRGVTRRRLDILLILPQDSESWPGVCCTRKLLAYNIGIRILSCLSHSMLAHRRVLLEGAWLLPRSTVLSTTETSMRLETSHLLYFIPFLHTSIRAKHAPKSIGSFTWNINHSKVESMTGDTR